MKAAINTGDANNLVAIQDIPIPLINDDQVLIKTKTIGLNPLDWKMLVFFKRPSIAGCEASGVAVQIGKNVTGLQVGGIVSCFEQGNVDFVRGKFAEYVVANPLGIIKYDKPSFQTNQDLPLGVNQSSSLNNFEAIGGVTLCLATAVISCHYSLNLSQTHNNNEVLLVWGGSTVSGLYIIQLAKLYYGMKVFTTSSSRNFDFLKSLGADKTFDYNDQNVVELIQAEGKGNIKYAVDCNATLESFQTTFDCTKGSELQAIDNLLQIKPNKINVGESNARFSQTSVTTIFGDVIIPGFPTVKTPEGLPKIFRDFWQYKLPVLIPRLKTPKLRVLQGLDKVNMGLTLLSEQGVSCEKIVIRSEKSQAKTSHGPKI